MWCGWELLLPHVLFTFHPRSTVCKAEAWALPLVYQETEEAARKEQQESDVSFNIRNFWSSLLLGAENLGLITNTKATSSEEDVMYSREDMKMKKAGQLARSPERTSTPAGLADAGAERYRNELALAWQSSYLQMFSEFSLQLVIITYSFKSLLSRLGSGLCCLQHSRPNLWDESYSFDLCLSSMIGSHSYRKA